MKKLFLLFSLAFMAMSCEEIQDFIDDKGHGLVFLEGEMKAYFDDKGDTKNYKFKADLAWSAEVSADWVEVDPTSGPAGENKIKIKVDKNKSDEKRTGYVDITLSNDKSYRIELEQLAAGENLDDVIESTTPIPNNEIWYTNGSTTEPTTPNHTDVFGANIVSNTFDAEKECWVIGFDGDVTTIGDEAFYRCSSLTSVTIPDSVTAIGEWAFGDCGSLTSVTMGEGVETVGGYAFANCPNLNAVHITDLAVWCNIDFINPKTDGGIVFSANPLCHGARLYLNKELVTDLIIPDGITEIRMMTFSGCSSLTSVTIPDGVTTIGRGAFIGCSSITNVIIPDSVTTIRSLVFCECISLKSVTIPSSVTEIGTQAFCWCYSLTSITIPNNLTTMGVAVFGYCNNLSEFNGQLASEDGKCLVIDGKLFAFAPEGLSEYTIPNGVTTIGNYAFLGCSGLTSVTIGDSVTTIGDGAFRGCGSLTSVTIGDSVTTIGSYAFAECENLEAVHITDLVSWCNIDFINPLTNGRVDLSANPLYYAHNLYLNGELVTDLVIPDGVNEIKFMAFALCESIKSVTIGNSVTTIGDWVFYNCTSLTSVTIGDSVTTIGYAAFYNCWSLTSITIPDSVTTIGGWAFSNCSSLTSVTIPNSVTTIGDFAFVGCSSLTSITIPDSVTTIGDRAFYYCSNLTNVFCKAINPPTTIVNNNGYWYGFAKEDESGNICNIDCTIYVPAESVEAYKSAEGWSEYADRIVADTSTSIIRYTTRDGNPITPNNNMAVKSNTYINGEGVLEFYGNIIGVCAFRNCDSLTSVTISDSVTAIGYGAFAECDSLTCVTIGDSVTTIGDWAFAYCSSLTSVTIPDSVTTIGDYAFYECDSLTSVTIGDSVTTIGDYAFAGCYSLTSVTIPESVTTIGDYAFAGCYRLTSVTIPESVTTIGYATFAFCENLKTVYCKAINPPTTIEDNNGYWYGFAMQDESGNICNIDCTIYVPAESVEAYKSAEGWSEYADAIVGYEF